MSDTNKTEVPAEYERLSRLQLWEQESPPSDGLFVLFAGVVIGWVTLGSYWYLGQFAMWLYRAAVA